MDLNISNVNNLRAKEFDNWTTSEDNFNKAISGQEVEEFKMFDFNASSYSSDLKDFA